jgi:C1A family cysteine protease
MNAFDSYRPKTNAKKVVAVFGVLAVVAVVAFVAFSSDNNTFASGNRLFQDTTSERFTIEELEFMKFITEHRRFYFSKEEYNYRFNIFRNKIAEIKAINANSANTFKVAINKFADLTTEEFKYNYLNSEMPKVEGEQAVFNVEALPASVDWRNQGAVTNVKDQGQCGSCWTFSATGSIEGSYAIQGGVLTSFAEQELVDCAGVVYGSFGCNGGQMTGAFRYVKSNGQHTWTQYPYTAKNGACVAKTLGAPSVWVQSFATVASGDNDALAASAAAQPTSVAIEADQTVFQSYKSGILNSPACGTNLDHGVLVVGYGTQAGQDYWIVKNSWGASWGENGYIRIAKQSGSGPGICGIALSASSAVVKKP